MRALILKGNLTVKLKNVVHVYAYMYINTENNNKVMTYIKTLSRAITIVSGSRFKILKTLCRLRRFQ